MSKKFFRAHKNLKLELGGILPDVEITYHTYGTINKEKNNVIWVCHALTANSDVLEWWPTLFGEGKTYDPANYFIVCANILGSCYGSSGPLTINDENNKPYYSTFPPVTIRDMVHAHLLLKEHLKIATIHTLIGGSMGGYQAIEWAFIEPEPISRLILIATGAKESAWGIAIHTAQRMAIETDTTWDHLQSGAGARGLKTARAIGMLTYRNYLAFVSSQTDEIDKIDEFKASSYIHYQGEKLVSRFNAYSYWLLTKAMDSHNIARGRGILKDVLKKIQLPTLVIGINSDMLCPVTEQQYLANHLANASYYEIDSLYGHDGFLIEGEKIGKIIQDVFSNDKEKI
ncbi:MAG: homoserine O-acetyltransferase [Bacteroidia bacterium]